MSNSLVKSSNKGLRLLNELLSLSYKVAEFDGLNLSSTPFRALFKIVDEYKLYNLRRYIRAFDDVPDDEIAGFVSRLQNNEVYRHRVGASLLELGLLEDDKKASWLGKLTLAYSRGAFNEEKFDVLRYSIRNTYAQDLQELRKFYDAVEADPEYRGHGYENTLALQRLGGAGLLSGPTTSNSGSSLYYLNEYGKLMVENALM